MHHTKLNSRGPRELSAPERRRWRSGLLRRVPSAWTRCKRTLLQLLKIMPADVAPAFDPLRWRIYQTWKDAEAGHREVCTEIAESLNCLTHLALQPCTPPPTGVQ
jgi:hypothetical protein